MTTKKTAVKQPRARTMAGDVDEPGAASSTKKIGAPVAARRQAKSKEASVKAPVADNAKTVPSSPKKDGAEKSKKNKLVRDSFTMPEAEYDLVAQVKKRCVANGLAAKKSEVLRAAIASFAALSDATICKALAKLESIKTGRPAKEGK